MPESLLDLEQQRSAILQQMLRLPDFRSGSITATRGTCGKLTCRCHQPNQPGHGPNYRLTRKVKGKTVTESFATPAELHKAQREVEAYHAFVNWRKRCWRSTRGSAVLGPSNRS